MSSNGESSTVVADEEMVEQLIARSGDLKGELVEYGQGPRFAKQFNARTKNASRPGDPAAEQQLVLAIDQFVLQDRLADGRTVVERFVAEHSDSLTEHEREMMLGWRDAVDGPFEFHGLDQGDAVLHNLLDDVTYRVRSNMGTGPFEQLEVGMFALGRIVPVHPSSGLWLVSGHFVPFAATAGQQIAQTALETVLAKPDVIHRNPELLRQSWEQQADDHADFTAMFGSDLLILSPDEAATKLREFRRHRRQKAATDQHRHVADLVATDSETEDEDSALPQAFLAMDSVAVLHDEVDGLTCCGDYARLEALFAGPSLRRDYTYLKQLREYLADDTIPPVAIRRLVQRHPEGADRVFRALLRKPDFSWERDGEELLHERKKRYFDGEEVPAIAVIGDRLHELLEGQHV